MKYPMAPYWIVSLYNARINCNGDKRDKQGLPYHDQETHSDSLADLDEFALVGYVKYTGQFMKFRVM